MYEHKIIKSQDKAIGILQKECWGLCAISEGKMYFKKKIIKKSIPKKEKIEIEEPLYFNKSFVRASCSYFEDIEEKYKDWRDQRQSTGKFEPFTERSEKIVWNKISKVPKVVAEEMLNNAIQGSWGRLIDLQEHELSKILEPLRREKQKEEMRMQGFVSEEDKQKAEREKQRIQQYIINNPSIREQARLFVEEKHSSLSGMYKDKMITARIAKIAKDNLDNNK